MLGSSEKSIVSRGEWIILVTSFIAIEKRVPCHSEATLRDDILLNFCFGKFVRYSNFECTVDEEVL